MYLWKIRFSYRQPETASPYRFRDNGALGILADTMEEALEDARKRIPEGATAFRATAANCSGKVDVVVKSAAIEDPAEAGGAGQ